MRVLLMTPPGGFTAKAPMPPLGLLYVAAALREAGHEVTVRDYAGRRARRRDLVHDLRAIRPAVMGITVLTESRFAAAAAARIAKRLDPAVRVIVGGPHPSGAPEDTARCPHFDTVVTGQAEAVAADAITAHVEQRRHPPPPCDLDDLPLPARDLLPAEQRTVILDVPGRGRLRAGHLVTSRGCPFDCAFCASGRTHGRGYRAHSVERVMAEVEGLRRDGVEMIWFCDDVFNAQPERLSALCEALRRLDPPMPFAASIRTDLATRDQLDLLRAAGCVRLFFGVESANETILRQTCGKTCSVEQARSVVRWCDEVGIEKNPGYILGLPGETVADAFATIDLMREIGGRSAVSFLRIYPGTRIERLAVEHGLVPEGFSWWDARALKHLVCRPAFGETPIFLDGLTWRDVGRLSRAWAAVAHQPVRRRGLTALARARHAADLKHLVQMALGGARNGRA